MFYKNVLRNTDGIVINGDIIIIGIHRSVSSGNIPPADNQGRQKFTTVGSR